METTVAAVVTVSDGSVFGNGLTVAKLLAGFDIDDGDVVVTDVNADDSDIALADVEADDGDVVLLPAPSAAKAGVVFRAKMAQTTMMAMTTSSETTPQPAQIHFHRLEFFVFVEREEAREEAALEE